ncbi:ABC transporter permease [Ramlibacter sp. WS9]|uniref:ABC transporter permease n=1 Tax=Ramlibacter sp. WS9 TaxID=1882741 RepID=UPI0011422655|nr:ABC transporter permease subunit [Ramlibacter sp. WS9]ROZ71316.1 ABC transporter permease subunit [Ramlibacter sp. WS9]
MTTVACASNWQGWLVPPGLLLAAELAMRVTGIQSDSLALPSRILLAGGAAVADGSLLRATLQTLTSAVGGVLIGGGIGMLLGFWLGLSSTAARLAEVSVELFRPIPPVALIPIAMLVFGFGYRMELSLVAFTCFWPMLLFTHAAVRVVDRQLIEVARILGLSGPATVWKIVLPAALPRIVVALRLSLGIALIVAVTTEIAANPQGLGYAMMRSQQELQAATMYAFVLWLAVLGWAMNSGLQRLQRRLFAGSQAVAQ